MSAVMLPELETLVAAAGVTRGRPEVPPLAADEFYRLTVAQYHEMIENSILGEGEKVELLDGILVKMMSRNHDHDYGIQALLQLLFKALPDAWGIRPQCAITLAASEPEPDYAVVRGPATNYRTHHPTPGEIGLVIEVADSSLRRDQRLKAAIYAEAGLPVYWIVNLADRVVEVYTRPNAAERRYEDRADIPVGETIPLVLDGAEVARLPVGEFMP